MFQNGLNGKHHDVLLHSLTLLRNRFATDANTEGYLKDGPVSVARFELGEDEDARETRALRQREAADVIESLLGKIEAAVWRLWKGYQLTCGDHLQVSACQHPEQLFE